MSFDREKAMQYWNEQRVKALTANKPWFIKPPHDVDLLFALDLMGRSGEINHAQVKKISQVNHMIQLLQPQIMDLCLRLKMVRIVDAGCGSSFLSLSLAWLLKNRWEIQFQLLGIDSNPKVVEKSRSRARILGLEGNTQWETTTIEQKIKQLQDQRVIQNQTSERFHVVLALHACDTATDQALTLGLQESSDLVAVVPCCHRELAQIWKKNEALSKAHPLRLALKNPQIRNELATHFTDALRMGFMRHHGYEVTSTEFVSSEHTPKNRLLLCERRGLFHKPSLEEFEDSKKYLGSPALAFERLYAETIGTRVKES